MNNFIEHLAELPGFRDRDALDVAIIRAVHDVLRPTAVGIFRCVGEPGAQHWLTRARLTIGDAVAHADLLSSNLSSLPELDSVPARRNCLLKAVVTTTTGEVVQTTCFPISTEREVVGVLEISTPRALTSADRKLITMVLRIYGNLHDLLDHSERDPLTGLLNRQTFDAAFMRRAGQQQTDADATAEGQRTCVGERAVWLGVADIDFFKRVNDDHGHLIGDEVLLLMSRLLRSSFRLQDRLFRFGGEEFVVMVSCVAAEQALLAFERLRANVEHFVFPQVGQVTVSIGFSRTESGDAPSAAFARADKALYYAKQHGRNQVRQYEALVGDGSIMSNSKTGPIELF